MISVPAFLRNLGVAALLAAGAAAFAMAIWGLGRTTRAWLARRIHAVPWAVELACGMAALSLAILGAGLAGLLYRPVMVALALPAVPAVWRLARARPALGRAGWGRFWPALFLLPAVPDLLTAPLLPVVSVDMLVYHLGVPDLWRMSHKIFAFPGNMTFSYPLGLERLAIPSLLFGAEGMGPWLQLGLLAASGVLVARTVAALGSPHGEMAGWLAFAIAPGLQLAFLGHPDAGMLFGVALAAHCAVRGSAVGMAVACGFLMSVKYTGLEYAMTFLAAWAALGAGSPGRRFRVALVAGVLALVPCLPWLARNWLETGNPLYPFFSSILPSLNWREWNTQMVWRIMRNATVLPDASGPLGSFGGWLGLAGAAGKSQWFTPLVVLWACVPLALFARSTSRPVRLLAVQAALFAVLWAVPEPKVGRYLLPGALVPLALYAGLLGGVSRRVLAPACSLVILWNAFAFAGANREGECSPGEVLFGGATPKTYWRASMGVFADMVESVNARCVGPGRVLVIGEPSGWGFRRPWLVTDDTNIPAWRLAAGRAEDAGRMRVAFRQAGIRWVVYNPARAGRVATYLETGTITVGWLGAWGLFWKRWTSLIESPRRFDWTGGLYLYGVRDRPARPPFRQPFLPGMEPFQVDLARVIRGELNRAVWKDELEYMGDYGIAWHHRMLVSINIDGNRKRAIAEGREAIRRGIDLPWHYAHLAQQYLLAGDPCAARQYAERASELAREERTFAYMAEDARRECAEKGAGSR